MSSSELFAAPLQPSPEKLAFLLDRLCEHRPWFNDFLWDDPQVRRNAANARIAEGYAQGFVWEVYRGPALTGILLLDSIVDRTSAECHFVFFDKTLGDKLELCRTTMQLVFDQLGVHTLRVEIPAHVKPLVKFCRKLGFRYESEVREPADPDVLSYAEEWAAIGSRKRHAMRYQGAWIDSVLLSVTKEEFAHGRPKNDQGTNQLSPHSGADQPAPKPLDGVSAVGSEPLRERDPAVGPPATDSRQLR